MTTTVSLRLPEDLKKQATDVFNEYGLDWSSAMRMILTQVVSENAIPVNLSRYSDISPTMKSNRKITPRIQNRRLQNCRFSR